MSGVCEKAELSYIIRDHDKLRFEERKALFTAAAKTLSEKYGEGVVECIVKDSYYNMREVIENGNLHVVEYAKEAMSALGITPNIIPIRGGTDGAKLSFMGIPCPNLSTGAENFHSRFEFACSEDMEKMVDVIIEIAKRVLRVMRSISSQGTPSPVIS